MGKKSKKKKNKKASLRDGYVSVYSSKLGPACYESHPAIKVGGGTLLGGSCSAYKTADDYVGLDYGMAVHSKTYPWHPEGEALYFPITDGGVPKNVKEFNALVEWIVGRLVVGRTVHVGCIGGHGRTGLVLAAVIKKLDVDDDAIRWLRKHYCKEAVETTEQVDWLHEHFEVVKAAPSRKPFVSSVKKPFSPAAAWVSGGTNSTNKLCDSGKPLKVAGNIWGD